MATIVQLSQIPLTFPLFYRISNRDDCIVFLKELWQLKRINGLLSLDYHPLDKRCGYKKIYFIYTHICICCS